MSQLLQNAAYGTAMILAVALLRRVLRNRLLPGARLALWAACLFRLLTPAAPESVLSLWGLSRLFAARAQPAAPAPASNAAGYILPTVGAPTTPAPQAVPAISWETVLAVVWLAVGAALALRYVLAWNRTRRAVDCAVLLDRSDPRYAALPKCARLREGPMEGAPLTFGAVRPTVVLLPGLEGAELDCVLAHEGVHAARRDNLWHYAMALALVVHWWNPAVWLMSRLLRRDIELSCDRAALKKLGADRRADYANALVSLAAQTEGPAFCQTFGRKAAEERILSIMKFKKTSVIGVIFTLALVLAVTVAFASEPNEPNEPKEDDYTVTKESTPDWSMSSDPDDGSVKKLTVSLVFLEKSLAEHVADGSMAQEEADRVLEVTRSFSKDGLLTCAFQPGSGLYGASLVNPNRGLSYLDGQGNFIPTDPATVLSVFVFPSYAAVPDDVIDLPDLPSQTINDYEVVLPSEVDENGNSTFRDEDGNVILQGFSYYILDEDGTVRVLASFPVDTTPGPSTSPSYAMAPTTNSSYVLDPGASPSPAPSAADPLTAQPAAAAPAPQPSASAAAPVPSCGVAGCTETRYHTHSGGQCVLLSEPCPVEGCTIAGNHTHNGVNYSCNGYHSGGHCDGSCYTYSTPSGTTSSGTTSSGTHHNESHSSGHHGSGHH